MIVVDCCLPRPWRRDPAMHRQEYGLAAAITAGCALFIVSGRVASKVAAQQRHTSLFGVALMLTYLAFDGFTSTWQVRMRLGYWSGAHDRHLAIRDLAQRKLSLPRQRARMLNRLSARVGPSVAEEHATSNGSSRELSMYQFGLKRFSSNVGSNDRATGVCCRTGCSRATR